MAREHTHPSIPQSLREFIAAEATRRGLRRDLVTQQIAEAISAERDGGIDQDDIGASAERQPISDLRLNQILEASMAMEDQAMPITPQLWQDMKRKFFEERGLPVP